MRNRNDTDHDSKMETKENSSNKGFLETRKSAIDAKIILSNYRNCNVDEMNDNYGSNIIYLEHL